MMVGEDAENPDPKAFNNKPVLSRIAVIAAGPVFNFILAFLFAMIIVLGGPRRSSLNRGLWKATRLRRQDCRQVTASQRSMDAILRRTGISCCAFSHQDRR